MNKRIIYIYASWCESCHIMTPTMEQVKKHIPVNMVNADYEDVIGKYNVRNIPATILVENNQESRRFIGTKSLNQILSWANNG